MQDSGIRIQGVTRGFGVPPAVARASRPLERRHPDGALIDLASKFDLPFYHQVETSLGLGRDARAPLRQPT